METQSNCQQQEDVQFYNLDIEERSSAQGSKDSNTVVTF